MDIKNILAKFGLTKTEQLSAAQVKGMPDDEMQKLAAYYSSRGIALEQVLACGLPDDVKLALLQPHVELGAENVRAQIANAVAIRDACAAAGGVHRNRTAEFVTVRASVEAARGVLVNAKVAESDEVGELLTAHPQPNAGMDGKNVYAQRRAQAAAHRAAGARAADTD